MSRDTFDDYMTEMKMFMSLVLKISFNLVHQHKQNPLAKQKFDSFFPPKKNQRAENQSEQHAFEPWDPRCEDYAGRIKGYVEEFVLRQDEQVTFNEQANRVMGDTQNNTSE